MNDKDDFIDFNRGKNLDDKQSAALELHLEINIHDVSARLQLLGFYFESPSNLAKWNQHAIWFAKNRPDEVRFGQVNIPSALSSKEFNSLKMEWLNAVSLFKEDVVVLKNAAKLLGAIDLETGELLWKRLIGLHPSEAEYAMALTKLYIDAALQPNVKNDEYSKMALTQGKHALRLEKHRVKKYQFATKLFEFALRQGELKYAQKMCHIQMRIANEMSIFHSEIYHRLGRLSLESGNEEQAKMYLRKTLRHPICQGYELAEMLVNKGHTKFVLKFLKDQQRMFSDVNETARHNRAGALIQKWTRGK
ncbi:MAG: hypothetical protein DKT66_01310 [Candidatus Melainabacteria bacterium]|nr:MAG: hypothetical protein DKT66_01310 [Candidatus Melainabacteria bacterium]